MNSASSRFDRDGYAIVDPLLSEKAVAEISAHLQSLGQGEERTRTLLSYDWCIALTNRLKIEPRIRSLLVDDAVGVQCTYLPKTENDNWKIGLHRDFFVPVRHRLDAPGWSGWSQKEGMLFVRPPVEVLEKLVAVRVHLEENTMQNGPLLVVPSSHSQAEITDPRVVCCIPSGGALAMRPLLLHASSKVESGARRVLHFVFGPRVLPHGQEWANAV